jgi:hypothetical protein
LYSSFSASGSSSNHPLNRSLHGSALRAAQATRPALPYAAKAGWIARLDAISSPCRIGLHCLCTAFDLAILEDRIVRPRRLVQVYFRVLSSRINPDVAKKERSVALAVVGLTRSAPDDNVKN